MADRKTITEFDFTVEQDYLDYMEDVYGLDQETVGRHIYRIIEYPEKCADMLITQTAAGEQGEREGAALLEKIFQGLLTYFPKLKKQDEINSALKGLIKKYGNLL